MLITWQVCNKASYTHDTRFSKNVFIIAPNLTVKDRLQVLLIGGGENYYIHFNIVPPSLYEILLQGKIIIHNWQALAWDKEIKEKYAGLDKEIVNEATVWVSGLDRIHRARGILTCYDFSATPFAPSGKKNDEEALFSWIVSDFGLNDGIESGLVKTPRIVVRDDNTPDAKTFRSKLYHIYMDDKVKDNINKASKPETPLPPLIIQVYNLLGADWLELYKSWSKSDVPPVMITAANRTETAARIEYAFLHKRIIIDELCERDHLIRIDSKILAQAEAEDLTYTDTSSNDFSKITSLTLKASDIRTSADLAPVLDGKTDLTKLSQIDLEAIEKKLRMQEIIFKTSAQLYEVLTASWKKEVINYAMLGQIFRLVELFLESGKIEIEPILFFTDPLKRKLIYMLNMEQHLLKMII